MVLRSEVAELRSVVAGQGRLLEEQQRQTAALLAGAAWQSNALAQLLAGQQHLASSGGGGQGGDVSAVGDDGATAGEALSDAHASARAPTYPVPPPPKALVLKKAPRPVAHLASSGISSLGSAAAAVELHVCRFYMQRQVAG